MRALLLLAILLFPFRSALAQSDAYPTGLDLVKRCHALEQVERGGAAPDAETVEDYGYCLGFVVGYVSGFAARDAVGEPGMFCAPSDTTIGDFVHAIQGWLVQHPDGLEQMGAYVAVRALQAKYPCAAQ